MICIVCQNGMKFLTEDLYICSSCSHISSSIKPDTSIYDKSYVIKYSRYERSDINKKLQSARLSILQSLSSLKELEPILDFGCGVGSFVRHCQSLLLKVQGFDINPYSEFCNVETLFQRYSSVTFWDSLEHLSNPVDVIEGLKPKYIAACAPCTDDFKCGLENLTQWHHYMPQEHCHYFSEESLVKLFESCGYSVVTKEFVESDIRRSGGHKNIVSIGGILRG